MEPASYVPPGTLTPVTVSVTLAGEGRLPVWTVQEPPASVTQDEGPEPPSHAR